MVKAKDNIKKIIDKYKKEWEQGNPLSPNELRELIEKELK